MKNKLIAIILGLNISGCEKQIGSFVEESRLRVEYSLNRQKNEQCYVEHFIDDDRDDTFEEYVLFNYKGRCNLSTFNLPVYHIILDGKESIYLSKNSVITKDISEVPQTPNLDLIKFNNKYLDFISK
jgi:hypothetical protein